MRTPSRFWLSLALMAVSAGGPSATAMPAFFASWDGDLSASALFEFNTPENSLTITLTNTSTADVLTPSSVLTGLFFGVSSGTSFSLRPAEAVLGDDSSVLFTQPPAGGVVGGEWAFVQGKSGLPGSTTHGISSSGLGIFGPKDRFPGPNLQGPDSPGGLEYGLTSAGDDPATGNQAVAGSNALIQNEVIFTLTGFKNGFDPSAQISHVYWQYGTSLTEPSLSARSMKVITPEPAAGILLVGGLLIPLLRTRRRRAARA